MQIHVESRGTGPKIVFTHGIGSSSATWSRQLQDFSARCTAIVWDLPAHGASQASTDPQDYSRDSVLSLLDGLVGDDGPVVLVGHSLGGYLSLAYAITRPGKVRGLGLIATGPGYRDPEARAKWNESITRSAAKMGLDETAAHIGLQHDDLVMAGLSEIRIPAVLMVGERDERYHGGIAYMQRKMPQARTAHIPGGGHNVQESHPDEVNAELQRLLDDTA